MACSVLCFGLGRPRMNQAIGVLGSLASGAGGRATIAQVAPAVPAQRTLDAELRGQRLRVVALYSFGLGLCGTIWVAFWLVAHARGWLGEPVSDGTRLAATVAQAAVVGGAGWYALYLCRLSRLRRATYTNVAALALSATINLAFIRNAEGAAVMIYAIAASLAALVIEGREWLWWGGVLALSAMLGSLLHSFPAAPLVEFPQAVATASLLCATTLGLAVPMALFWLFSRNLTASREEAWALARTAAEVNHLATARARQLAERTEQLQAKNAELNDFLYVVSHDLRAPLINLAGFSRALQDAIAALHTTFADEALARPARWTDLKTDIDESLDFIVRSVEKMDFLVQKLLELSRIDSRPNLTEPVALNPLIEQIVDSLHFMINARGIAVQVDPLPVVRGDPVRISQVFANLIDNAVKYSKPQGAAAVHVGCTLRGSTPQFFVRDTGVGIRPQDQAKIFRLFGRVGAGTVPGDGMGLTAVKKILEKHGGRIWVESALGQGSTFWFTLPGDVAEEQEDDGGTGTTDHQDLAG
jgi:signal transduction histidine kinase